MSDLGDITKLKVPELKVHLKERGLPISGTKQVLIERLGIWIAGKMGVDHQYGFIGIHMICSGGNRNIASSARVRIVFHAENADADSSINDSTINESKDEVEDEGDLK